MRRLLFGLVAIVTGCSGSDAAAPAELEPVGSVAVRSALSASLVPITTALQLEVVLRGASNTLLVDRPVRFMSSDERVAAVDAKGLVTGLALGNVKIVASSEGKRGEIALQVVPEPCPPDPLDHCNRADAYVLVLVDDHPLPVKSPFGAGDWDYDDDAGTWRLTAALLLLNRDGTFANVVTHEAASGRTSSQTFVGSFARISASSLRFLEGPLTYRGENVGDRLTITFTDGMTFVFRRYRP